MSIHMSDLRDIAGRGYPVLDLVAEEIEDMEKAYALLFAENAKLRAEVERLKAAPAPQARTLSDFIRNATPEEKDAVYREVMEKATARQLETLAVLSAAPAEGVRAQAPLPPMPEPEMTTPVTFGCDGRWWSEHQVREIVLADRRQRAAIEMEAQQPQSLKADQTEPSGVCDVQTALLASPIRECPVALPMPDRTLYGPNRTVDGHFYSAASMRLHGQRCYAEGLAA